MRKSITYNATGAAPQEAGFIEYVAAADELQIIDVRVEPKHRRQGLAEKALRELLAENRKLNNAYLEVRAANTAALKLYKKLGFAQIGIRKNYYRDPAEDAVLMSKKLTVSAKKVMQEQ
ncbi:MAG: ribosomal protein S18-alanine N-acetyltransferase [Candidatus Margulisbacteria bacterium]|jgi:ribosomal-protein-alanine N-acetyltransferase|nr:ribosomal protein S18-alanine N-acetyltransferase [Candidatus Margulisiibacteriota bacterium]